MTVYSIRFRVHVLTMSLAMVASLGAGPTDHRVDQVKMARQVMHRASHYQEPARCSQPILKSLGVVLAQLEQQAEQKVRPIQKRQSVHPVVNEMTGSVRFAKRVGAGASVYLAAFMEYLSQEKVVYGNRAGRPALSTSAHFSQLEKSPPPRKKRIKEHPQQPFRMVLAGVGIPRK